MKKMLFLTALVLISTLAYGCKDENAQYKVDPAVPTSTVKSLSESEAGSVSLDYLRGKYPEQPAYEVYSSILRPNGNWQIYVRNEQSRGIICIDKSGKASGLYDANADCSLS